MRENELLTELPLAAVEFVQEVPVLADHGLELGPFDTAHRSSRSPSIGGQSVGVRPSSVLARANLVVQEADLLLDDVLPVIPVLQDCRASRDLLVQELYAIVEFTHALGNLFGRVGNPQVSRGEGDGIEELLEPAILEGPEQTRADPLAREPAEHCQLAVAVDELLNLWTIHPQEHLSRRALPLGRAGNHLRGRCDDVDGVGQGTAQPLDRDGLTAVQGNSSPALEAQGMRQAEDVVLEDDPGLSLLLLPACRRHFGILTGHATTAVAHRLGVVEHSVAAGDKGLSILVLGVRRGNSTVQLYGPVLLVAASKLGSRQGV